MLHPLKPAVGSAAEVTVSCKVTGKRLRWNEARLQGWKSDPSEPAFSTYYSPDGIKQLSEGFPIHES